MTSPAPAATILIVDDEAQNRKLLETLLRPEGYVTQCAANGEEALASVAQHAPDLILLDVMMPGLDGYQVATQLKANPATSHIPIIMVTASVGRESRMAGLNAGAEEFLMKPVDRGELWLRVRNLLRLKALGDLLQNQSTALEQEVQVRTASLRESERRFSHLLGNIEMISVMLDANACITYCNDYLLRLTGWTRPEVMGRSWFELFVQTEHLDFKVFFSSLLANKPATWHHESEILTRLGERRLIRWNNSVLRSGAGDVIGTASIGEDITEQKRSEEKIKGLNRLYAVLSGINTLIVRATDRQQLFDEACRISVELGGFGMVWIGLLDAKTLDITPIAWGGYDKDDEWAMVKATARDVPEGRGSIGQAVRNRRPVIINDMSADATVGGARRRKAIERGFRSTAALPLIVDGEVAGTFVLFSKEINFFSEEEIRLLTELAGDISYALEHIAKVEKIARLSRVRSVMSGINSVIARVRGRQELFDGACRIAVEHGKLGSAWIGTLDPPTQDVTPVAWAGESSEVLVGTKSSAREDSPRGKGAVGRAIRERRPVFNNDIAASTFGGPRLQEILRLGFQSQITLPLYENQAVVATLTIYARESNFFDEEEVRLLTELAGDISLSLEHIEKTQKLERMTRVNAMLSGINGAIVRIRGRQALFEEACRIALETGGMSFAWVGVADGSGKQLQLVASAGRDDGFLQTIRDRLALLDAAPEAQGLSTRALREGRVVVVNDVAADPVIGRRKAFADRGIKAVAIFPLFIAGRAVGVFALHSEQAGFFDDDEMRLLNEVAANIAFALDHIEKEQKITRLSRIQAVMGGINALIVRVRNRQELFDEACRIAVEHGKFGMAWIGAFDSSTLEVYPVAWSGPQIHPAGTHVRTNVSKGQGVVSRAIREKQAVFDNDIAAPTSVGGERRALAIQAGFRSLVALPFVVEGVVVGQLSLYAREPDFFTGDELSLLADLAGNISFAFENINRQQKLEKLSRIRAISSEINVTIARIRDRQALLDAACRIVVEQAGFPLAWIGMFDPATRDLKAAAMAGTVLEYGERLRPSVRGDIPAGQGTNGRAFREKKPIVDNDIAADLDVGVERAQGLLSGILAALSLPLLVGGAPVGVMGFYSKEKDYFDNEEIALLAEVAGNISFALDSLARQEKLDKLARIRAVSSEINATIIRIHDSEALLRETCRIAVEHGKFELVWIGTVDTAKQQIQPVAWHGFPTEIAHKVSWASSSTAGGTLGEAIRTAKPTVRSDIETEMSAGGMRAEALNRGCFSTVCMPLVVDNNVVALISLFAPGKGFFDADELALLNEVAADVSFALQDIEKQKKLEYLSHYDALTGLPNRALFYETLKKTLALASGKDWRVAVLFVDLDYFKNVNDTLGHVIGDELLCQFSNRLLECVRIRDTVGRLGGDEFALILLLEHDQHGAAIVAGKIREALRAPFDLKGHEVTVTASIGITVHPEDASDPETLIKYADTAMYRAKQAGRDNFHFFTAQMNTEVVARLDLETALRKAVENGEFVLHYQPKAQLSNGRIAGVEALLRWQRPGHGLVPPNHFIPVLEETGLIVRVGSWVITEACRQIGLWMRSPIGAVPVAVNVSGRQFIEGDLSGDIVKALGDNGIPADLLELEITESSLMANTERTIASLQNLKKLGVQVSIDDFGTGYSSLAYLSRFPIDKLKIDIAFIRDVTSNPDHAAIVLAIIRMAHDLKLDVIAEGVETAAQLEYLRRHRCDLIQGYFFSRPLPLLELEQVLSEEKCLPAAEAESGKPLKTLLLVDDEPRVLDVLQRLLHLDGYYILSARSAAEGFELLALHPVQVILCDQRMPGMSGTDFLDRVKNLYSDTFRIVLSAHNDPETIMEAINRGAVHRFYSKPWDGKVLREYIREAFRHYWLLHDAPLKRQGTDPENTLPPRRSAVADAQQKKIPAPVPAHGKP